MKKKKKHFNPIEEKIIRKLYSYHAPLTTYEVAKECGISFPTAKKYLLKLSKDGILNKIHIEGKDDKFKKKET